MYHRLDNNNNDKSNNNNNNNKQHNIIIDALGGSSRSVKESLRQLVGSGRCNSVLRNMQKAVISSSLNIARTFKVLSD